MHSTRNACVRRARCVIAGLPKLRFPPQLLCSSTTRFVAPTAIQEKGLLLTLSLFQLFMPAPLFSTLLDHLQPHKHNHRNTQAHAHLQVYLVRFLSDISRNRWLKHLAETVSALIVRSRCTHTFGLVPTTGHGCLLHVSLICVRSQLDQDEGWITSLPVIPMSKRGWTQIVHKRRSGLYFLLSNKQHRERERAGGGGNVRVFSFCVFAHVRVNVYLRANCLCCLPATHRLLCHRLS